MTHADGYGISRALAGGPDECGDEGILEIREDCCFLALVDALGHGRNAHGVARLARECLTGRGPEEDLPGLMRELHERLRGTTGAVVALCRVFPADGRVSHVGIGNVTARVLGPRPFTFLSRDGVVGYRMPSPTERTRTLLPGEVLILHSDGIREHVDFLEHPDLLRGSAREIATGYLERFGKRDDDASCVVMRLLP